MHFDAIVVPRGAEAAAVVRAWPAARRSMIVIPAGEAAGRTIEQDATPAMSTALVLGLCGGIDPALRVGDTAVYGRTGALNETFDLDPELVAACAVALERVPVKAVTVAQVVGKAAAKRALREATGAAVIDMEGAALARAFARRGVRVAMVRVVSDDASSDLPDLADIYDDAGRLRPLSLALALIRAPARSLPFISNARRALEALGSTAARIAHIALN